MSHSLSSMKWLMMPLKIEEQEEKKEDTETQHFSFFQKNNLPAHAKYEEEEEEKTFLYIQSLFFTIRLAFSVSQSVSREWVSFSS